MPFTSLNKIKPFISFPLYNALTKDDNFTKYEAEASIILRDKFFLQIPSGDEIVPDYIHFPIALIIQKLSKHLLPDISPEQNILIERDYESALTYLFEHQNNNSFIIGNFIEAIEW